MPGADDLFAGGAWTDDGRTADIHEREARRRNPSDCWFAPVVWVNRCSRGGHRQIVVFSTDEFRTRFTEASPDEINEVDQLFDSGKRAVRIISLSRT